jgi:hypothetical protein
VLHGPRRGRHDGIVTYPELLMQNVRFSALVFALSAIPAVPAAQQAAAPTIQTYELSPSILKGYQQLQTDLAEAAGKMPDEFYSFRPASEIRPFGQLVAHVALAQFRTCAQLKGEADLHKDEKEDKPWSKTEALALLKASTAYCDPQVNSVTDTTMAQMMDGGKFRAAKGLFPVEILVHGSEMYGAMAVYLRLKGLVPPTTERMTKMKASQEK